jgi:ferric-dicitrate binding protein FerR (iron transport regulator)
MKLLHKTNWNLLAKDIAGEASENEKATLEIWLARSVENRVLYEKMKSDWINTDPMKTRFDVDNAWKKLHTRIAPAEIETVTENETREVVYRRLFRMPMRVAASLLFLALLGTATAIISSRLHQVKVITGSEESGKRIVLPDGSSVVLNENSQISYTKSFNRKSREIMLRGEAYFDVEPDKAKPFVIYAGQARIRVVGTSFNVDVSGDNQQVEVYVASGVVELSEKNDNVHSQLLTPGSIGWLNGKVTTSARAQNENAIAWRTGNISFNGLKLSEAITILNDVYHVNIRCTEKDIDTARFEEGERFQNESLDDILQVICKQNQLKVEKSDDMIYLSRQ